MVHTLIVYTFVVATNIVKVSIEKVLQSKVKYKQHESVILNILYNTILIENSEETIFRRFGITRAQYNVLRILKGAKGVPMNLCDVQGRMLKRMSNTTRLVDKLLAKELVQRIVCPDNRRKVEITITQSGLDLLEEISPVLDQKHHERLKNLSDEEQLKLIELLEKLRT